MRLPKITLPKSTASTPPAKANKKRGVLAGNDCNPLVVKDTPFTFATAGAVGLAFGTQTFYMRDSDIGIGVDTSNLPKMTAIRNQIEYVTADESFGKCNATDYTFPDDKMSPQYVLAPGQTLKNFTFHSNVADNSVVWKLTPYLVADNQLSYVANGSENVYAPDSGSFYAAAPGLTLADFPVQLALRPLIEDVVKTGDGDGEFDGPDISTLAPTNVIPLIPRQTSYDLDIISFLGIATTTSPIASATPVIPGGVQVTTSSALPAASTSVVANPTVSSTIGDSGIAPNAVIAGAVLGSLIGVALVGKLGHMAYNKITKMREEAKLNARMQEWIASRGIELNNLPG